MTVKITRKPRPVALTPELVTQFGGQPWVESDQPEGAYLKVTGLEPHTYALVMERSGPLARLEVLPCPF